MREFDRYRNGLYGRVGEAMRTLTPYTSFERNADYAFVGLLVERRAESDTPASTPLPDILST